MGHEPKTLDLSELAFPNGNDGSFNPIILLELKLFHGDPTAALRGAVGEHLELSFAPSNLVVAKAHVMAIRVKGDSILLRYVLMQYLVVKELEREVRIGNLFYNGVSLDPVLKIDHLVVSDQVGVLIACLNERIPILNEIG